MPIFRSPLSVDSPEAIFARSRRPGSAGQAAQPHYAAAPWPNIAPPRTYKSLNGRPTYDVHSVARRLRALCFIETFDDAISLQPGEPIDPKDPIELIDLVLETYGEQTIGLFDLFHTA
jgi:hypothetical protein